MVEALVAMSLTAMASAVVLLAIETQVRTTDDGLQRTMAEGLATQLIDEVLGMPYAAPGSDPHQYPLGPTSWEAAGRGRERFDETGDFNGFAADTLQDRFGQPLGQEDGRGGLRHEAFRIPSGSLDGWHRRVRVYYVDPNDLSRPLPAGQTSDFRAVEVTVGRTLPDGTRRQLAHLRRVFAYVPAP